MLFEGSENVYENKFL